MCVPIDNFNIDYDKMGLDPDQLAALQAQAGTPGATTGTTTPPVNDNGAGDGADRGSKTGIAGGGDKGMTPNGGLTDAEMLNQQLMVQINDMQGDQNLLNQQITAQAEGFQSVAQGILQSQQSAADALRAGFLDLTDQQKQAMKAADDLRKNTGQAQRKPNYSLKLKENAAANRGGITSTMLTGTGGVATNQLTLGRPALLGGGA